MPVVPTTEETAEWLRTTTADIKLVSDYTRMPFDKVLDLDCYTFRVLLRDALICDLRQTEDGQKYLEDAWILTQTSADTKGIRKLKEGLNA